MTNSNHSLLGAESELQNLTEITEDKRNVALTRMSIITPFLEGKDTLVNSSLVNKIPIRTIKSWVKRYRNEGFIGLIPKSRNDINKPRAYSLEIKQLVEGLHLSNKFISCASIHRKIKEYAIKHHLNYPSYRTVHVIINNIGKDLVALAHEGSRKYKEKYDLLYMRETNKQNEIWQADHTLLDVLIKNHDEVDKRPWLTIIFDDYSRAIAGYQLSFLAPSAIKTSLALRQAIWYKKEVNWRICGIPAILYTDHGSDFTSKHIEQVCCDLKIRLIFSQVAQPRGRGKIERFFLTLNQMCLSSLDGYIKKDNKATLTLTELDDIIKSFIIEYNNRIQERSNVSPQECWDKNGFLPNMPESLEQLDLLLLTVIKSRKVRRDGIHFQGLRYVDPLLASYINEDIIIRYDPSDITEIRVFYKNKYLCRPVCQELANQRISLKEIEKARNERKKELNKTITERLSLVDAILKHKPKRQEVVKKQKLQNINKHKIKFKLYTVDE